MGFVKPWGLSFLFSRTNLTFFGSAEMGRRTQLQCAILSNRKMHEDRQILRVQHFPEANYPKEHTTESLSRHAGMSLRNFHRRIGAAVGKRPSTYLQRLRIEAKRLLETSNHSLDEITAEVAYEGVRSFRRVFQTFTDLSPKAYRQWYGTMAVANRASKGESQSNP